jgi:hypothetical protein
MDFKEQIEPFWWVQHKDSVSFCLSVGEYKNEIFEARADEGFEGNGYDWASLATVFIAEQMPELADDIEFDPEAGMFCVYSENEASLRQFALAFREACDNDELLAELFSRAELD